MALEQGELNVDLGRDFLSINRNKHVFEVKQDGKGMQG
jgi:hypothetical protein